MFDVSWNDPTRETVGQRRTRKESHADDISRGSSVRSSGSSNSRASKSSDSVPPTPRHLFGNFGIFGSKKEDLSRANSQPNKLSSMSSEERATKRLSSFITPEDSVTTIKAIPPTSSITKRESTETEAPSDGSIFSEWAGHSGKTNSNTDSTWSAATDPSIAGQQTQASKQNSYVTQSTEVTVSKRNSVGAAEQLATVAHISSAGTIPIHFRDSTLSSSSSKVFDFPVPRSQLADQTSSQVLREDIQLSPKGWPVATRSRNPDSWQPPDAWECPTPTAKNKKGNNSPDTSSSRPRRTKEKKTSPSSSDLAYLRRSIRRMEAASTKIVLERLREEWLDVPDASVYRELELEKQWWMLSALKTLSKQKDLQDVSALSLKTSQGLSKILSLYENHASASFLAAVAVGSEIHHFSPSPLSPRIYPNIHPLTVPSPTHILPYASTIFRSIHAFSISPQLPASSLPAMLRECNRTLAQNGTLHLTILDPAPLSTTTGPLLSAWLDSHLLINLERQFRCVNPSRHFPIWLADASLRGEGSTITTTTFLACPSLYDSVSASQNPSDGSESSTPKGQNATATAAERRELKSQVGRMLWRELWGSFVEGDKWWWDDEGIMEECERAGTCWEFAVIEAVKE